MRHSPPGGGRIGEVTDDVGSIFTKLKVVFRALFGVEQGLEEAYVWTEEARPDSVRVGPNLVSWVAALLFLLSALASLPPAVLLDVAIGKESPRSFPLLATPMPQVKVVLYPEQSLP